MLHRLFKKGRKGPRLEIGSNTAGGNGFGAPYKQAWEFRPLPGAGAQQYAWETLALPLYTPIGWGVRNQRQFRGVASSPVMVALQGVTLSPIQGSPIVGEMTGQFTQAPLLDVQQAEEYGIQSAPYQANTNEIPLGSAML